MATETPNPDHDLFTGVDEATGVEYLLRVYSDGSREIAVRAEPGGAWSPSVPIGPAAVNPHAWGVTAVYAGTDTTTGMEYRLTTHASSAPFRRVIEVRPAGDIFFSDPVALTEAVPF
ncbi:unannotated protein [freshwater metagenome]|uniref:Unannotated protein n=1 Tax=freshwater metagenome TaxID=449393 RepID=A0A6J6RZZ1_9ZZZZ